MVMLVSKVLSLFELGVTVGPECNPLLTLRFGIIRSYARSGLGLKENEVSASGRVKTGAVIFKGFHAVLLGRCFGKQQ